MTDRAVSDAIGFVLVFSLIIASVGVVYTTGFAALSDSRDEERVTNAVRAFDVLADNFEDIYRTDAPSRATEIKLSDASLAFGEETELTVNVTNVPGESYSVDVEPIVYRASNTDTTVVYENGATFRTDRGAGVMKRAPHLLVRDTGGSQVVIVPVVQTRSKSTAGVGGSSTVLVRSERVESEMLSSVPADADDNANVSQYDVTITMETDPARAEAWMRYLDDQDGTTCTMPASDTVECTVVADELRVSVTRIDVSFA
jgi:hypothetical protein